MGAGVRRITLNDIRPDCRIVINGSAYDLREHSSGKVVLDVGCGHAGLKGVIENAGGTWVGIEPFEGGAHSVAADAMALPFANESFDVVVMNAVLEHIPNPTWAIQEVARVLVPGGVFVGYAAFMECFHEISYSHLSFKALEYMAAENGMRLRVVEGGRAFGIDYHLAVLLNPLPAKALRRLLARMIRGFLRSKAAVAYPVVRLTRQLSHQQARDMTTLYYQVECLRQSVGFGFLIEKVAAPCLDQPSSATQGC